MAPTCLRGVTGHHGNTIAKRAAQELQDGQVVSLGIGIPTLIANHVATRIDVVILTPNGASAWARSPALIVAISTGGERGGRAHNAEPRGSYIDSATRTAWFRAGRADNHLSRDLSRWTAKGSIASYVVPARKWPGWRRHDLLVGARVVNVITQHCSKRGEPRLVKKCTFPLTGQGRADVIITERGVFRRCPDRGFVLEEVACGYTLDDIAACTEMDYMVAETVKMGAYGPELGAEE